MKKIVIFIVVICLLIVGGYAGYEKAISFASVKAVEKAKESLAIETVMEEPIILELKEQLQVENVNREELPFTTVEEGMQTVLREFSLNEIMEIATDVRNGLSEAEQVAMYEQYKDRFTEDEWKALILLGMDLLEN